MRLASIVALLLLSAGCHAPARSRAPEPNTSTAVAPRSGSRSTCAAPTRFGVGASAHELRGTSPDASLFGLSLGPGDIPPRAGQELKIVWRMTGHGPLRVTFTAPDGHVRPLVFGPEPHSASTYRRPGAEWGTGFRFTAPGCWHIRLSRADTSGDVWIDV